LQKLLGTNSPENTAAAVDSALISAANGFSKQEPGEGTMGDADLKRVNDTRGRQGSRVFGPLNPIPTQPFYLQYVNNGIRLPMSNYAITPEVDPR
jgi:hypothetical protein